MNELKKILDIFRDNIQLLINDISKLSFKDIIELLEYCKTSFETKVMADVICNHYSEIFGLNIINIHKINNLVEYDNKKSSKFYFPLENDNKEIIDIIPISQNSFIIFYYIGD